MMMLRLLVSILSLSSTRAFVAITPQSNLVSSPSCIYSKKGDAGDEVVQQQAFAVGSFVEFVEKKRTHIGKIGGARYQ